MYPRTSPLGRLLPGLAALVLLGGCGGSSDDGSPLATKAVRGPGFEFRAPAARKVERTDRAVTLLPAAGGSAELESVTRYPLIKPFRPNLWPGVRVELDAAIDKLADGLAGTVESAEDVRVAGRRARRYEIVYEREGRALRQRITFVFRRREEFQLLCRYARTKQQPPKACTLLEETFTLA